MGPESAAYTGFRLTARVTHLLRGPELEVPAGFVVLSIEVLGAAWWTRGRSGVIRSPALRAAVLRPATSQAAG